MSIVDIETEYAKKDNASVVKEIEIEIAMKILRSRLLEKHLAEQAAESARLKGKHVAAGWGNQIRSYVLHPYKMVKDHRTDYQVGNTDAVLDGDLEAFITAYIRQILGKEE